MIEKIQYRAIKSSIYCFVVASAGCSVADFNPDVLLLYIKPLLGTKSEFLSLFLIFHQTHLSLESLCLVGHYCFLL